MFYVSGDIHGCVEEVISFCERNKLSSDDTIILLGDVGISTKTGYKMLREGKIQSIKVGREYIVTKLDLIDYLMKTQ